MALLKVERAHSLARLDRHALLRSQPPLNLPKAVRKHGEAFTHALLTSVRFIGVTWTGPCLNKGSWREGLRQPRRPSRPLPRLPLPSLFFKLLRHQWQCCNCILKVWSHPLAILTPMDTWQPLHITTLWLLLLFRSIHPLLPPLASL